MLNPAVTIAAAALLELDNVQAGQFLFARPAFAGPVLGWLSGCPLEGARIGLLTELMFMDFMSVGGAVPPNGLVAAAVGVLVFSWARLPESLAFFAGLAAGRLYRFAEARLRSSRSSWTASVEDEVRRGDLRLGRRVTLALLSEGAVTGLFISLFALVFFCAAMPAGKLDLAKPYGALDFAYSLMPWLGLSCLYFRFRGQVNKKAGL